MTKSTNFDRYLDAQLRDPAFAARFDEAGAAWDVAVQLATLRRVARVLHARVRVVFEPETSGQELQIAEAPAVPYVSP